MACNLISYCYLTHLGLALTTLATAYFLQSSVRCIVYVCEFIVYRQSTRHIYVYLFIIESMIRASAHQTFLCNCRRSNFFFSFRPQRSHWFGYSYHFVHNWAKWIWMVSFLIIQLKNRLFRCMVFWIYSQSHFSLSLPLSFSLFIFSFRIVICFPSFWYLYTYICAKIYLFPCSGNDCSHMSLSCRQSPK